MLKRCGGLLAALLIAAAPAGARPAKTASSAERAVDAYYRSLINAPSPQTAELALFVHLMPKGGDLHHHYTGSIYAETYLDGVEAQGWCVDRDTLHIETQAPHSGADPSKDCLSAGAVRADNGVYRALLSTWSDKDYDNHSHAAPPPDKQFFDTFGYFGPTALFQPNAGLKQLKDRAKAENLQYIETMLQGAWGAELPAFAAKLDALPPDASDAEIDALLGPYAEALAASASEQKRITDYRAAHVAAAAGIDDADFTLRFEAYVLRALAPSNVFSSLYTAYSAAKDNPLIVGVNIVAPENGVVSMRDYHLHMRMFHLLNNRFPGVHLSLHAGELAPGMTPPEGLRNHIRQAVEIAGAERIGHGVDIASEDDADQLLAEMKARNVAVEINLTSNAFILGVSGEAHPVTLYARHGVPFVLATDDAGVSRSSLSQEYLLYVSRYRPSYAALKAMVFRSLEHAFLPPDEKRRQLAALRQRFARFETRIRQFAADRSPQP